MRKHWKAILGVTLIFVFGWISGVLSSSLVIQHRRVEMFKNGPIGMAEMLEQRVTRNLHLDPPQQQQVHALVLDAVQQRERLQGQIRPQLQVLNRQMNQQIEALLRPDQRETFRTNLKNMRKRVEKAQIGSAPADNPPPVPASK